MKQKNESSADRVFAEIKQQIIDNKLLPGDRMPSENALAEQYKVSRLTIRAALQKLAAFGFTETKNGSGTYIARFDFSSLIENVSGMMTHNISAHDVDQFRTLIEMSSMRLLQKQRILSSQIGELKRCLRKMSRAAQKTDSQMFAKADYEFHRAICQMSGNGMFTYAYELTGPLMTEYFEKHYNTDEYLLRTNQLLESQQAYFDQALAYHQDIVDAIESKDFSRAMQAMEAMFATKDPALSCQISE